MSGTAKYLQLLLLLATFPVVRASPACAQDPPDERAGAPRIYVRTSVTAQSHPNARAQYLGSGREAALTEELSTRLAELLNSRARAFALPAIVIETLEAGREPPDPVAENTYVLHTDVWIDADASIGVESQLYRALDRRRLHRFEPRLFLESELRIAMADMLADTAARSPTIVALADTLTRRLEYQAYRWMIDSAVRFVVRVEDFVNLSRDTAYDYLGRFVAIALQTELTQSPTISLISDAVDRGASPNAARGAVPDTAVASYTVGGTLTTLNRGLRVDVTVVKHRASRILASRRAILDSIDLNTLSVSLARLGREVRFAMEADFRQQKKALTVVGIPAEQLSSKRRAGDIAITAEIARAFSRKLKLLTVRGVRGEALLPFVVRDATIDTARVSAADPFAWLARADADYLVLLRYQDLGDRVRLSTDLEFADPETPVFPGAVPDRIVDKADLAAAVDSVLVEIVTILGAYGATESEVTDSVRGDVWATIRSSPMHSIVKNRQAGVRFGAVLSRPNTDFFFGENAGNYIELHYSQMLPSVYAGRSGGRFGVGLEAVLGLDLGEDASLGGAAVASGLVNGKLYLTPWKHSRTTINITLGGGAGLVGLRYSFSPGDRNYTGRIRSATRASSRRSTCSPASRHRSGTVLKATCSYAGCRRRADSIRSPMPNSPALAMSRISPARSAVRTRCWD
jgi:TolB-like protein